ncbi:amidohydrolase family protein [Pseudoxanthomonas sp.]|uniref:amidohydrolase family protein n=1 Tax=Pseudoxanthomonas sp. TaxID=1871049 RepID=UPI00260E225C|nr:amidohydrolase family protein [Pseudoxanthomonas sp.]WDS37074.1 MAG: CIA30 family protein [Pseudoxanthomonas sp.]
MVELRRFPRRRLPWALLLLLPVTALAAADATKPAASITAIVNAEIFDALGHAPYRGTLLIAEGRIVDLGRDVQAPAGARIVDAHGQALLPGLIDVHTHWTPAGEPEHVPQIAAAYLAAGVTTVNDFNEAPEAFAPLRSWLKELAAPHVNLVARIGTTNGHGADWADVHTTALADTPAQARRVVQGLLPYAPDAIKVFHDGWRYGVLPDNASVNEPTLAALVDEAHAHHLKVLTHTVTIDRADQAAQAGVDVLAHIPQDRPIDTATLAALRKAGTAVAPTLAVYEPIKPGQPADSRPDAAALALRRARFAQAQRNVKALFDAGVPIAVGTDAGMPATRHGVSTAHEVELLVQSGLSPSQALTSATRISAQVLGLAQDRGTLAKGQRADLILVDGQPWRDASDLHKVQQTWIDGRLVHAAGQPWPSANLAQSQAPLTAAARIDDFERSDGRSSQDTLRVYQSETGQGRSQAIAALVPRGDKPGQALSVNTRLSASDTPEAGVVVPLSAGSIRPVSAAAFHGIELDVRGHGALLLQVNTLHGSWQAPLAASDQWQHVRIAFDQLKPASRSDQAQTWSTNELISVAVLHHDAPLATGWFALDDLQFY